MREALGLIADRYYSFGVVEYSVRLMSVYMGCVAPLQLEAEAISAMPCFETDHS
jgi:hypothetical protein